MSIEILECDATICENNEEGYCPVVMEDFEEIELDENGQCRYFSKKVGIN